MTPCLIQPCKAIGQAVRGGWAWTETRHCTASKNHIMQLPSIFKLQLVLCGRTVRIKNLRRISLGCAFVCWLFWRPKSIPHALLIQSTWSLSFHWQSKYCKELIDFRWFQIRRNLDLAIMASNSSHAICGKTLVLDRFCWKRRSADPVLVRFDHWGSAVTHRHQTTGGFSEKTPKG